MARALVVLTVAALLGSAVARFRWSFIPVEAWKNTADPIARVFNDRLYVYTSWDNRLACGKQWARPKWFKRGSQKFCMVGYRVYSTNDPSLLSGWKAHGAALIEEDVPWVYKGGPGYRAAARMWAPCVVQGDDKRYYLFFPAPTTEGRDAMRIGVAVSATPTGPFKARKRYIRNVYGIDPSVIKLPNGTWVMFSSSKEIYWQTLNADFSKASHPRRLATGLISSGYKEGPFSEIREDRLVLQYAHTAGNGYTIRTAVAQDYNELDKGFDDYGVVIHTFDGRTNHGSVVTYRGRSWSFYHRHFDAPWSKWYYRRAVFSPVTFTGDGTQEPIWPGTSWYESLWLW